MRTIKKVIKFITFAMLLGVSINIYSQNKSSETKNSTRRKILLITSSEDMLPLKEGNKVPTGYFLDELTVPAQALIKAGYEIVLATPKGNIPHMDEHSNNAGLFQNDENKLRAALEFVSRYPAMQKPISLRQAIENGLEQYAAVYVPGGHAPMVDLMTDKSLGQILNYFHKNHLPTALLCHGPVATLASLESSADYKKALIAGNNKDANKYGKNWIYSGYRMTIYSNEEEYDVEKGILKGHLEFYVADALKKVGGKVEKSSEKNKPLVVRDRELITGQNPASDHEIADLLVKVLQENKSQN